MTRNWQLTLLLAIFILPVIISLYMLGTNSRSFATVQNGTLIQNPQPLTFSALYNLDGSVTQLTHKKWHLVYVAPTKCLTECQQRKQLLSNLQIALGAQRERLQVLSTHSDQIQPTQNVESILVLDPVGLFIMQYAPNADAGNILKDLKRLLKYSHA